MKPWITSCLSVLLLLTGTVPLHPDAPPPRWRTAGSTYPPEARSKRIEGTGTVHVTTDANGWVQSARMERSTGSKILDDATLQAAHTYWQGPPNTTANLPVEYRLAKVPTGPQTAAAVYPGWTLPPPSYPADAGDDYEQGRGEIRVSTDPRGQVVRAVMLTSTGHARLDADAVHNAETHWHGPPATTIEVPIAYQIPSRIKINLVNPDDHFHTPIPPYPYKARNTHGVGSGVLRFTTDAWGRAARAAMVQSTGNADLDENTVNFALANWSGPPNRVRNVPITYRLY